jgi:hypothetical protein
MDVVKAVFAWDHWHACIGNSRMVRWYLVNSRFICVYQYIFTRSSGLQLEGRLSQFPLRELIEMVVYSSVKGLLELRAGDELAVLYFSDGAPCCARAGGYNGLEAVGYMFELPDADFRFYAGSESESDNIWMDPWELMESAEHLARSWAPLRPHIPSLEAVPVLEPAAASDGVQINDTFWPVLSAVDGQRSVLAITRHVHYSLLDVCMALVSLKQKGLITIRPMAPRTVAQPVVLQAHANQSAGYFEKLIARTLEQEAQNPDSRYAPPQQGDQASDDRYRSTEQRYVDAEG